MIKVASSEIRIQSIKIAWMQAFDISMAAFFDIGLNEQSNTEFW